MRSGLVCRSFSLRFIHTTKNSTMPVDTHTFSNCKQGIPVYLFFLIDVFVFYFIFFFSFFFFHLFCCQTFKLQSIHCSIFSPTIHPPIHGLCHSPIKQSIHNYQNQSVHSSICPCTPLIQSHYAVTHLSIDPFYCQSFHAHHTLIHSSTQPCYTSFDCCMYESYIHPLCTVIHLSILAYSDYLPCSVFTLIYLPHFVLVAFVVPPPSPPLTEQDYDTDEDGDDSACAQACRCHCSE